MNPDAFQGIASCLETLHRFVPIINGIEYVIDHLQFGTDVDENNSPREIVTLTFHKNDPKSPGEPVYILDLDMVDCRIVDDFRTP